MKKFVKIIIITLVLVGIILGGFAVLNYLGVKITFEDNSDEY